jgi:hypothetical protein
MTADQALEELAGGDPGRLAPLLAGARMVREGDGGWVAGEAVREKAPEMLVGALVAGAYDESAGAGWLRAKLAEFGDAARALGTPPADLFARAADVVPDWAAELIRDFVARPDAAGRVRSALERAAGGDPERLAVFRAQAEWSFETTPERAPEPGDYEEVSDEDFDAYMEEMERRWAAAPPPPASMANTRDELLGSLIVQLNRGEDTWLRDWRDLLLAMAPYAHRASDLGIDRAALFEEAARFAPDSIAHMVGPFGRRKDLDSGFPRSF